MIIKNIIPRNKGNPKYSIRDTITAIPREIQQVINNNPSQADAKNILIIHIVDDLPGGLPHRLQKIYDATAIPSYVGDSEKTFDHIKDFNIGNAFFEFKVFANFNTGFNTGFNPGFNPGGRVFSYKDKYYIIRQDKDSGKIYVDNINRNFDGNVDNVDLILWSYGNHLYLHNDGQNTLTINDNTDKQTIYATENDNDMPWASATKIYLNGNANTINTALADTLYVNGNGNHITRIYSGDTDLQGHGNSVGRINGGFGNDTIAIDGNTNTINGIWGHGGDDVISVGGKDNVIRGLAGGSGKDSFYVNGRGNNITAINGGAGDDDINLGSGDHDIAYLFGGSGRDVFELGDGSYDITEIDGGNGNNDTHFKGGDYEIGSVLGGMQKDNIRFDGGDYSIGRVLGNNGDDKIIFYDSHSNITDLHGGGGDDYIALQDGSSQVQTINGGRGNDRIDLMGGDHRVGTIRGRDGDDHINLQGGVQVTDIHGGDGDDTITLSGDNEIIRIIGGTGNDFVDLSEGNNSVTYINGGDGTDTVQLAAGSYNIIEKKGMLHISGVIGGNAVNYIFNNIENLAKSRGAGYTFNVADGIDHVDFVINTGEDESTAEKQTLPMSDAHSFTDEMGRVFHSRHFNENVRITGGENDIDVIDYSDVLLSDTGSDMGIPAVAVNLSRSTYGGNDRIDGYTIRQIAGGEGTARDIASLTAGTAHEYHFAGGQPTGKSLGSFEGAAGSRGADVLIGGDGGNYFVGGHGDDSVYGLGGNDEITGGDGNDWLSGGAGGDTIYGDDGDDVILGGAGSDRLFGGSGNDDIVSGLSDNNHTETLVGGEGDDNFYLHSGNQLIWTGDRDYNAQARQNDDRLFIFVDSNSESLGTKTIRGYDNVTVDMVLAQGVTKGKWHFGEDDSMDYKIGDSHIVTIATETNGGSQKFLHTVLPDKITRKTEVGNALHRLAEMSGADPQAAIPDPFGTFFVDVA